MLYRTCKRMIERGNLEGMSTKLDVFYAASKLTDDEYKELTELLAEKECPEQFLMFPAGRAALTGTRSRQAALSPA